jgi:hypothetical protein
MDKVNNAIAVSFGLHEGVRESVTTASEHKLSTTPDTSLQAPAAVANTSDTKKPPNSVT